MKPIYTKEELIALNTLGINEHGMPACYYGLNSWELKELAQKVIKNEQPNNFIKNLINSIHVQDVLNVAYGLVLAWLVWGRV